MRCPREKCTRDPTLLIDDADDNGADKGRSTLKPSSFLSDLEKCDADDQEKICNPIW